MFKVDAVKREAHESSREERANLRAEGFLRAEEKPVRGRVSSELRPGSLFCKN